MTESLSKLILYGRVAILVVAVLVVSHPTAKAQNGTPAPHSGPAILSLASFVAKLDWDPQEQGALLIVSPEQTLALDAAAKGVEETSEARDRLEPPIPTAAGNYKSSRVAVYFDRRIVRFSSLSVFAPRTMAVLNYKNLPPPGSYAGLSVPTKGR